LDSTCCLIHCLTCRAFSPADLPLALPDVSATIINVFDCYTKLRRVAQGGGGGKITKNRDIGASGYRGIGEKPRAFAAN
jgi:hypothetical protein